ncbi:hypothetical protein ACFYOD_37935 [Streptomyces sp. NPDC006703]
MSPPDGCGFAVRPDSPQTKDETVRGPAQLTDAYPFLEGVRM